MTLAGLIIIVCLMILPLMVFFIHPVSKTIIAGSTKELHKQNKLTTELKKEKIILKEGYEYIPVLGNCMSKNDIHEGDYVNVKMFDKTMSLEDKAKEIKEGDILYIVFRKYGILKRKIRTAKKVNLNNLNVDTSYYIEDMEKLSSSPHKLKAIKGKVVQS